MTRAQPLLYLIGRKPIIAAIRKPEDTERALRSSVDHLFFMGGSIFELQDMVGRTKQAGKGAFVHVDLIKGLSSTDKEAVRFIAEAVKADGIVTPKPHLIKEAKRYELYAVLHLFVLDSAALLNGLGLVSTVQPDAVEIMPGVVPKVITAFAEASERIPVIASGLIQTKPEAAAALQAGATALSVSEPSLWDAAYEDLN